jgi:hypothetical protein
MLLGEQRCNSKYVFVLNSPVFDNIIISELVLLSAVAQTYEWASFHDPVKDEMLKSKCEATMHDDNNFNFTTFIKVLNYWQNA